MLLPSKADRVPDASEYHFYILSPYTYWRAKRPRIDTIRKESHSEQFSLLYRAALFVCPESDTFLKYYSISLLLVKYISAFIDEYFLYFVLLLLYSDILT